MTALRRIHLAALAPWALFLAFPAVPAGAQVEELVSERGLEYRAARSAHESALAAQAAQERRFYRTLADIQDARAAGDEDRQREAFALAQTQALELQELRFRVDETASRLRERGADLLDALDARLEALLAEAERTPGQGRREELLALARSLDERYREVESEIERTGREEILLAAVPEIAPDPRDGPLELGWKIELLERRISEAGERLAEIDAEISDLERRRRRERSLDDLSSSIERFDDDRVPVSSSGRRTASPGGEGREEAALTLEERIERLGILRSAILERRGDFQEQLRFFRRRLQEMRR